ncbi:MAG: Lrp/AsnC family transcriptional regulator [Candidatus Omnitrophica bacterium]|nr:Lrp/AsnC family transcriptional regulator [Candidatus Omnitrophota bacterium]
MLTKIEKQILNFIQGDLPLNSSPYAGLAKELNIDEDKIAEKIALLKKRGYIRRLGALLSHDMVGLKANCMCVWRVPEGKIEKIGKLCAQEPGISHCYWRVSKRDWPYNFYTMVHAKTKSECCKTIKSIAKKCEVDDYKMLFTLKKFKKTSPVYSV